VELGMTGKYVIISLADMVYAVWTMVVTNMSQNLIVMVIGGQNVLTMIVKINVMMHVW